MTRLGQIALFAIALPVSVAAGQTVPGTSPPWKLSVSSSGGMTGSGIALTVTSAGTVNVEQYPRKEHCSGRVPPEELSAIETLIAKARPSTWKREYVDPKNRDGCCDMFHSSLTLERGVAPAASTRETSWNTATASRLPANLSKLAEAAFAAKHVCTPVLRP